MSLFRGAQLHPALCIQISSSLLHCLSSWVFNSLMRRCPQPADLRSAHWGATLRLRLRPIQAWAERQGLELAAQAHLSLLTQAVALLTRDPCVDLTAQNFRLKPDQVHRLLQDQDQHRDRVPNSVQTQDCHLEEPLTLDLPLLLPEQGYCSHSMRGVPLGLREFMEAVCDQGVVTVTPEPHASDWTIHFSDCSSETLLVGACGSPGKDKSSILVLWAYIQPPCLCCSSA
uniref:Dilute domain-containing protein n=1 Tax=Knipowitschia caucasica TaxID=637954 RepID=A0AAV2JEV3_KNICA